MAFLVTREDRHGVELHTFPSPFAFYEWLSANVKGVTEEQKATFRKEHSFFDGFSTWKLVRFHIDH